MKSNIYIYCLLVIIFCTCVITTTYSKQCLPIIIEHSIQDMQQSLSNDSNRILLGSEYVIFPDNARLLCDEECMMDFECLVNSYPGIITGMVTDDQKRLWLIVYGKEKILYDDGIQRSYDEAVINGTVKDSMLQIYPLEPYRPLPGVCIGPGRVRSNEFFQTIYGKNKEMVQDQLVTLALQGEKEEFSRIAGADKALQNVFKAIERLLEKDPQLSEYITPFGGTFCWRPIEGEIRLSPHSYGIAIDLNVEKGIYWRWTKDKEQYLQTQKNYPSELVQLFEENGFIWGGKWYEFDFMHFEYRPELICKAKRIVH